MRPIFDENLSLPTTSFQGLSQPPQGGCFFWGCGYCGNGASGAPCTPAGVRAAFMSQDTITK